ncbi:unnamed protein product [Brassicogethes aeneus]|uniref:GYF domain-containing protein n=1 Tax=Brassicogethes aeneus TaxID=1431903 RepID=A0A9P0BDX5_BRAAE|nr:unnamed protein product [Brassicogethes aeneus]
MTDSMNFGPDWIRNLSSEGNTSGGTGGAHRYQLADFRYGREEMLALFDKNVRPPLSLTNFKYLYSETTLPPLALTPTTDEERSWQNRPTNVSGPTRGRGGGSLERGGRIARGRGGYQGYGRPASGYDGQWGGGPAGVPEQTDWSPRKDFNPTRGHSMDNWRRIKEREDDDGWRIAPAGGRGHGHEKWQRSTSWRGGDGEEGAERGAAPPERGGRQGGWHENRGPPSQRRSWDNEDHLPEWATEHPTEGGGTFDERGAFHGSDDEMPFDGKPNKRDNLQKSTSQQYISNKNQPPLSSSKSAMSLSKPPEYDKKRDEKHDENLKNENGEREREKSVPNISDKIDKDPAMMERAKSEGPPRILENLDSMLNPMNPIHNRVDEDFEKLQEDLILKLVENEEPMKPPQNQNNFDMGPVQPPPNLAQMIADKWFYQDPQGQMQGPFVNLEMGEWFKAGYFSNQLKIRRACDERFFLLGELVTLCGGANPFTCGVRFPVLKNDPQPPQTESDILNHLHYVAQMTAFKQAQQQRGNVAEPWNPAAAAALSMQQQELAAQRLLLQQQQQQQQQVPQEMPFMPQPPATNPLMQMINQMQQANKLPGQTPLADKPPSSSLPGQLDPHLMHMNNLMMQSRLPTPEAIASALAAGMPGGSGAMPGMPAGLGAINLLRQNAHGAAVEQDNEPLKSLLKQLHQNSQQQPKNMWQQNQFSSSPPNPQWQPTPPDNVPMTMWDVHTPPSSDENLPPPHQQQQPPAMEQNGGVPAPPASQEKINPKEKEQQRLKEEQRELRRKKEQEEKQAKREAEERRKQEQRKQEAEKKASEEKRRKEEERIKKELEKAKKEAEEKRLKELEEKRRLKEQRKAEEEQKKKTDEQKKLEEDQKRKEAREREERNKAAEKRLAQQEQARQAKAAPWCQSNSTAGASLAEIQKAEREKRAQEAALQLQRQQLQEQQRQFQEQLEKPTGMQLSWASRPVEAKKVKSLAEIQAEEQERLMKQAAEARLQKEKEPPATLNTGNSIWNSSNLTWASTAAQPSSQWSSNSSRGFWDDSSHKPQQPSNNPAKPSTVSRSTSSNAITSNNAAATKQQQAQKQSAQKQQTKQQQQKKEEGQKNNNNNNNNGPTSDEFMNWCYKTLSNISANVDIPTFASFLRDIESAFDVREYCKEYLGESGATQQFASQFLERRRSFRPNRAHAHKDDMCSPAPAITPGAPPAISNEFQEVKVRAKARKTKNQKCKKSTPELLDSM